MLNRYCYYLKIFLLLLLFSSCFNSSENTKKNTKENIVNAENTDVDRPNIILILADDLGWGDVGYHGSDIRTPNIDSISLKGLELNQFYTSFSCTPSRVGLLTGKYPSKLGLGGKVITPNRKDGLPTEEQTIAELLGDIGYSKRACIGKWHLGHSHEKFHPLNQGFTYFYGHYGGQVNYFTHTRKGELDWHRNFDPSYDVGYTTSLITNEAVNFISNEINEEEPFFLYIAYNAPHTPLQAEKRFLEMYGFDSNKPLYSSLDPVEKQDSNALALQGQGNTKRQTYSAMVTAMDEGIGQILNTVKKKGIQENTIVIFLSDNGASIKKGGKNFPLKGEKGKSYEGGIKVPALVYWPEKIKSKKVSNEIFSYIDILPTLLDINNNLNNPEVFDGVSKKGILTNTEQSANSDEDRIMYFSKKSYRKGRWKLAYNELYDLKNDPYEKRDLKKVHKTIFKEMKSELPFLVVENETDKKPEFGFKVQKEWKMPSK